MQSIVNSVKTKMEGLKNSLKYAKYNDCSSFTENEKNGIFRSKVLSNINYGVEFVKKNFVPYKTKNLSVSSNSMLCFSFYISKLFFELTIPELVINNLNNSPLISVNSKNDSIMNNNENIIIRNNNNMNIFHKNVDD